MPRGFTLLELLITIVVLTAMMAFAVPSFSALSGQTKMTQLASSLQTFLHQAKSEAVFRNQDLWAHIDVASDPVDTGEWSITLTDSVVPGGNPILFLSGSPYTHITFDPDYTSQQIKFDGVRGKVKNGSIYFSPVGKSNQTMRLRGSYGASRVVVCGKKEAVYGYPKCES